MGEYAKRVEDGQEIKIGTCESMFGLRFEDRNEVVYSGNLTTPGLFFRLPYPDEDDTLIGDYEVWNRGERLAVQAHGEFFDTEGLDQHPGLIQARHNCGLLINVKCYHGLRLPDESNDVGFHWNGKDQRFFEIVYVKYTKEGLRPVFRCRHCNKIWSCDWEDILDFVPDDELRSRLIAYRDQ